MKTCKKCGELKPLEYFHKHIRAKDGLQYSCKDCIYLVTKKWRKNNSAAWDAILKRRSSSDAVKISQSAYAKTENGKLRRFLGRKAHVKRYPDREKARSMVSHHIKKNPNFKKPCVKCGDAKSQGHHPDYSKPLDVIWLCKIHHVEEHRMLRMLNKDPDSENKNVSL